MRNAIGYSITSLFFGLITGSVCHAGVEDLITSCAKFGDKDARIACLEDALRAGAAEAESPVPAEAPAEAMVAGTAAREAPEMPAVGVAATAAAPVELGAEQVASRRVGDDGDKPRVQAIVMSIDRVANGRMRFILDNGQVWQQTGDDDDRLYHRLPDTENVPIEMWQSRSGGYRLYLVPIERTIRVRRLE